MKRIADDENEVEDVVSFVDGGEPRVTPVIQLAPAVALSVVQELARTVRDAHDLVKKQGAELEGRAQKFEEGDVFLLASAYEGFDASRYLMDFYDVREEDICSRMHFHTGSRLVRIMTGPDTHLRIGTLSRPVVHNRGTFAPFDLEEFQDLVPELPPGTERVRHNLVVPPNSWVDMQIPKHVAHQFNAIGPNAVIDTIHPEERQEVSRESMRDYKMMAQTIFLAGELPSSESCVNLPETSTSLR